MKTITVKNIQIQFDIFEDTESVQAAKEMLDKMTAALQERFNLASPMIFTNSIDSSDVDVLELSGEDIPDDELTIRSVVALYPEMYNFHYKWRNTGDPELEKNLNEVLEDYGFKLANPEYAGEYNDLKGYLECEIVRI